MRRHGADTGACARIVEHAVGIRKTVVIAAAEPITEAIHIAIMKAIPIKVATPEMVEVAESERPGAEPERTPPREERIKRAAREPPYVSKSETKTDPASKADERDVGRRPDRVIAGVNEEGARPPGPTAVVNKPTAVVIRRPSPWFVGNPGPAVIRFINPATIAVRRPVRSLLGNPHWAVIGDFGPDAVGVEVLRACVVAIRVAPAFGGFNVAVAIVVPGIPIVAPGSGGGFVFRIIRARNGDHLPFINMRASLRGRDIGRAAADNHLRLRIGIHQDAIVTGAVWMNGGIRRIDFRIRLTTFQDGVSDQALPDLDGDTAAR